MVHRQAFVAGIISSGASSPSELSSELVLGTNTANRPAPYQRSNIDINITNHYNSKVYTSSSPIVGDVTITTKRDVRFDSIEIILLGNTRTKTEGVNSPVEIAHTFLKLTDQVRDQHVLLPPSMGKEWEIDDMAPTMASVEYSIKARVLHQPNLGGERIRIMEARKSIHVLPASPEEPPLNITENDKLYCMYKKKSLRKFLSSKIGTLTAEAIQPRAAILQSNGRTMTSTPMAQIRLKYEPTSSQQLLPPPSITSISGKVTAHTFFNAGTTPTFPNLGNWTADYSTDKRGVYSTSVPLPKISVVHPTTWQQHPCSLERRDSGYASDRSSSASETETRQLIPPLLSSSSPPPTTSSMPSSRSSFSSTKKAKPSSSTSSIYLTSTLSIPLPLPLDRRTFIPTFHSCIASRVYTLTLSVTAAVVGSTSASTTFSLTLPLQVAVEWDPEQQEQQRVDGQGLPHFESLYGTTTGTTVGVDGGIEGVNEEEEMAAAEEHLRPRVIGLPPDSWYREMQMQRESHRERESGREVVRGADNGGGQQQQQVRVAEEGRLPGYGEAILTR
ncbi:hypothetical protein NEUTE1DRAFT_79014 [Neurospora tetrasperma FGSC 2508]|uniref:Arrestin-like N-terminal domain-containing protein n=1 Tax=Neurospora tetrasperma (strain FGSC 2508 / ATCC MYA-4615 / P0657) TaxID=510951 RepID=F8MFB8_NEUT8|nr:uncharacterized protein NEUTE1DRAFT_79014 [Neurospora tetrasperma FGSC 2508]EGO59177.1 hypothetical protein NEUTE1DRAFT_79014 [Neurospora tetrasperma FGSC 2508]EGZ73288.1 hypothetical protein NEUTE2DRAFT_86298 [Neurospora tetrasperma FGSC 2509]